MKTVVKISMFVAIMMFAMMSCNHHDIVTDGATGDKGWPPSSVLSKYGLDGLSKPTGASDEIYAEATKGNPTIAISFNGNSSTVTAVKTYFKGHGWTVDQEMEVMGHLVCSYTKPAGSGYEYVAAFSNQAGETNGRTYYIGVEKTPN